MYWNKHMEPLILFSRYTNSPYTMWGEVKTMLSILKKGSSQRWRGWIQKITDLIYLLLMEIVMPRVQEKLLRMFTPGSILSTGKSTFWISALHRCELPGNYPDFIGVMVFYPFCRRTKIILVTTVICYKINKYPVINVIYIGEQSGNNFWNYRGKYIYIYIHQDSDM